MKKVVINRCYGGFSLSHEAILLYAEYLGLKVFPEKTKFGHFNYWTVDDENENRIKAQEIQESWKSSTDEQRKWSNDFCEKNQVPYDREIKRDDENLIKVVETLGERSFGGFAKLVVVEIPDDVDWEIEEYDGNEWVSEVHRRW